VLASGQREHGSDDSVSWYAACFCILFCYEYVPFLGGNGSCAQGPWEGKWGQTCRLLVGESQRERDRLEYQDIDGRTKLKRISGVGWGDMGCIDLAEDRDQWRAAVNTAMNLGVP
jgi:hypothetical protein